MLHLTRIQVSDSDPVERFIEAGLLPKAGDHMIATIKHDPLNHYTEYLIAYTGTPTDPSIKAGSSPLVARIDR